MGCHFPHHPSPACLQDDIHIAYLTLMKTLQFAYLSQNPSNPLPPLLRPSPTCLQDDIHIAYLTVMETLQFAYLCQNGLRNRGGFDLRHEFARARASRKHMVRGSGCAPVAGSGYRGFYWL